MNATQIFADGMTLDEQMEAIRKALENAQIQADADAKAKGLPPAPIDPADATMCASCQ